MKRKGYRQGEVGIIVAPKGAKIPQGFSEVPDNVIIEGEISGHKHEVKNGKLLEKKDSATGETKMILQAFDNCEVVHPEHKPIKVPKGLYEIRIQKEFKEGEAKKVKD